MSFLKRLFKSRLFLIIILVLVIAAIPLTVFIAQQQQEVRQRASETDKASSLRSFCINENCSQIRTYWNAPGVPVYYYFIRLFKEEGGTTTKIGEKWTKGNNLKVTFDIPPQTSYWFRVIAFQTPPTFTCDLEKNGDVANGGCVPNDPTVAAWYNSSVKSEANYDPTTGGTITARRPNDGELGMKDPTNVSTRCFGSTGTCNTIQLDWASANTNIFPSKRFLIRTPGHPTTPLGINPWPTTNSATTTVTPNTTYTGWTIQEYQGEPDMTDLEMYYGGIRSWQVGFGDISTVPPPIPAPTITQATCSYNGTTGAYDVVISWNPVLPGTGATYQATLNGQTQNFGDINTTWNTTLFAGGSYSFAVVAIDNIVSPPATGTLTCTAPPSATITPIPPTATPTPSPTQPPTNKQISATNTCSSGQPSVTLDIGNNAYTGDLPVFVYRRPGEVAFTHIGNASGTQPYIDTTVSVGTTYEYYVSNLGSDGAMDSNHVTITATNSNGTCVGAAATATPTTPAATATLVPGTSAVSVAYTLRGIGIPGSGCTGAACVDNPSPVAAYQTRNVTVCLYKQGEQSTDDQNCTHASYKVSGNTTFNGQTKKYNGTIPLPSAFQTGNYDVLLKIGNYLRKRVTANQLVTKEQTTALPETRVVAMDLNNDNNLNILDYNIFRNCLNNNTACTPAFKLASDFNADGKVDTKDLTIFGTSFQNQSGD